MKIIWDWSIENEANRLMQSARNIGNGFYHLQNFYPLPYSKEGNYLPNGVYLPLVRYTDISRFWQRASILDLNILPVICPPRFIKSLVDLMTPLNLTPPDFKQISKQSIQVMPQVIDFLQRFAPSTRLPNSLTIYPTYFGTGGSFNWLDKDGNIVIYHRIDQGIRNLVECFLLSILRQNSYQNLSATWSETQFLTDWIIDQSSLANILPPDPTWSGTIHLTRIKASPALIQQSSMFLAAIGAPCDSKKSFKINKNIVYFDDKILNNLTNKEILIMKLLIDKSPNPVSIDEIADQIFVNDDKYSLAAITKTIERLRKKLASLGISSSCLATASGIGYYLKN